MGKEEKIERGGEREGEDREDLEMKKIRFVEGEIYEE